MLFSVNNYISINEKFPIINKIIKTVYICNLFWWFWCAYTWFGHFWTRGHWASSGTPTSSGTVIMTRRSFNRITAVLVVPMMCFGCSSITMRLPSCLVKMGFHLVLNVYRFGALNVVHLSLSPGNIVLRQSQVFLFFIKTLGCCILCTLQKF